eukprot:Gb_18145 [translate_table: standard]
MEGKKSLLFSLASLSALMEKMAMTKPNGNPPLRCYRLRHGTALLCTTQFLSTFGHSTANQLCPMCSLVSPVDGSGLHYKVSNHLTRPAYLALSRSVREIAISYGLCVRVTREKVAFAFKNP